MVLPGHADKANAEHPAKQHHQVQEHDDGLVVPPGGLRPQVLERHPVQAGEEQRHTADVAHVIEKTALPDRHVHKQVVQDHHQDNAVIDPFEHAAGLLCRVEGLLVPEGQGHLHGAGSFNSQVKGFRGIRRYGDRHHKIPMVNGALVERLFVAQNKWLWRAGTRRTIQLDTIKHRIADFQEGQGFSRPGIS